MRDDPIDHSTSAGSPIDPVGLARRDLKKALPRRFWVDTTVVARDGRFGVDLDGRPLRTPAKAMLTVPRQALADAVAAEWRAQGETVEPDSMPVTRIVNSALDGVAHAMDATIADVAKFAETDLVCYRASEPAKLVAAQSAAWDPVLDFAREHLDARFVRVEGVTYVEQPEQARVAVRDAVVASCDGSGGALRLAALSVMTSLTGSVLLSLAVAMRRMTATDAWTAAHVDEDHQRSIWGHDPDDAARRDRRRGDMAAAALVLDLSR